MRVRVRVKVVVVAAAASMCVVVMVLSRSLHHLPAPRHLLLRDDHDAGLTHPAARITAHDLMAMGHTSMDRLTPLPMAVPVVITPSPHPSHNASSPCNVACQLMRGRKQEGAAARERAAADTNSATRGKNAACDRFCRMNRLRKQGLAREKGYASRVQVENVTLPESWTVTRELVDRLSLRRQHVQETCKKYGLDKATESYQPNAWEFLINKQHGLVWCNVFKAASSTWFYNFNVLAGYSENELLHGKEAPINMARKFYSRPSVDELRAAMNATNRPLSFMIVRHPFTRLVSGYRDKIHSGNRYYSKLSRAIAKEYRGFGPPQEMAKSWPKLMRGGGSMVVATFPQFVQFLLDEVAKGNTLDEHWTPMTPFCTPCLVPFDVFAKVETLEEDGNYIIFSAGIENIIKPKRINRARNEPTDEVADKFLCQLTKTQMEGLIQMYKLDLELFQYDVSRYRECAQDS